MLSETGVMVNNLRQLCASKASPSYTLSAKDYVEGMWRMLQQNEPEDFVLATGETHRVREFVEKAFAEVGMQIK